MNSRYIYDSLAPLESCEFKHCHRQIGISVSTPFDHQGFKPARKCVEIERETISVNTSTYAKLAVDADNWKPDAIKMTHEVMDDLDKVILELQTHRNRLHNEIVKLKQL